MASCLETSKNLPTHAHAGNPNQTQWLIHTQWHKDWEEEGFYEMRKRGEMKEGNGIENEEKNIV